MPAVRATTGLPAPSASAARSSDLWLQTINYQLFSFPPFRSSALPRSPPVVLGPFMHSELRPAVVDLERANSAP